MNGEFRKVRMKRYSAFVALLLFVGCSTHKQSTANQPRGYVDFYCETDSDLSWDVLLFDPESRKLKPAYSKYKPLPGNVVRVAAPAGNRQFQVGIFNRANRGPIQVSVTVEPGKLTPVKLTLEHRGVALVDREAYAFRGSTKGFAGGTKIVTVENAIVRIHLNAESPQELLPKEQMAYFRSGPLENKLTPTGR